MTQLAPISRSLYGSRSVPKISTQSSQRLRARALTDGIAAYHPGTMPGNLALQDGDQAQDQRQNHIRAEQHAEAIKQHALGLEREEGELGHPQPRKPGRQATQDHQPPGETVKAGPAAHARGELEGAQQAEWEGAHDVEHDRQGQSPELGIIRRERCAGGEPDQGEHSSQDRDRGEQDQPDWHQPIGPGQDARPRPLRSVRPGLLCRDQLDLLVHRFLPSLASERLKRFVVGNTVRLSKHCSYPPLVPEHIGPLFSKIADERQLIVSAASGFDHQNHPADEGDEPQPGTERATEGDVGEYGRHYTHRTEEEQAGDPAARVAQPAACRWRKVLWPITLIRLRAMKLLYSAEVQRAALAAGILFQKALDNPLESLPGSRWESPATALRLLLYIHQREGLLHLKSFP